MKAVKNLFILLLIAAAGLFAGHTIRLWRAQQQRPAAPLEKSSEKFPTQQNSPGKKLAPAKNKTALAAKLEEDLSMSSGVTRWLHWLEALEKSTPRDFGSLWLLAQKNPELKKLLATRWSENYPREFFDFLVANTRAGDYDWDSVNTLFNAWSKSDLKGFVAALENSPQSPMLGSLRSHAATGAIFDQDPETGLRLMSQWHIENHIPRMEGIPKWASTDPARAAQYALKYPAGSVTRYTMEAIGREWAKTDPIAALKFARASGGQFRSAMANAVLGEWTEQNIQEAAAWLAQTDSTSRDELSAQFVKTWAKHDLTQALDWAENNLSGMALTRAAADAVRGFAEKDIEGAADFVQNMPPSRARTEAAGAVARKWFPESYNPKNPIPAKESIDWLVKLDNDSAQRAVSEVTWSWSENDPYGMGDYLASANNDLMPQWIYNVLARNMTKKDPLKAMDWTGRLPEKPRVEAGQEAFSDWRRAQPAAALDWLTALPKEDPRRAAYFENAIKEWSKDTTHAEQLTQFTAIDPKAAEKILQTKE